MINQREWLQTRKKLLEQVKSQVNIRLGPLSAPLRQYAKSLETDFKARWRPSSEGELGRILAKAQLVLSADFHAYGQSQRAHLRILRDFVENRRVTVALECIDQRHDLLCARFLSGALSENKFLEAIDWRKAWGFPWEQYRPLFELARDRGYKMVGLGHAKVNRLLNRDRWMAERITKMHGSDRAGIIFAVIGEWHLASAHLPRLIGLKDPGVVPDMVVLYQDVENLYFQLAEKKLESSVEVLKATRNRFCLMVSPPWMKWQSYLMFLEHTYDRDLQEDLAIDYTDHVVSLVELLEADLKIETKKAQVQVYSPNSRTSMARMPFRLSAKQSRALFYQLEHDQSFYLPQTNLLYLSSPTINHASTLAGKFVHAQLCKRRRALWNLPQDFLQLIWIEAIGFLFSKWINPKRKPETLDKIRLQLAARHPQERGRKALLLALDHRLSEVLWVRTGRLRTKRYRPREVAAYLDASIILGSMLGERLFQKVRSRTMRLSKLMSYLKFNVETLGFEKFYWKLIREIEHDQSL